MTKLSFLILFYRLLAVDYELRPSCSTWSKMSLRREYQEKSGGGRPSLSKPNDLAEGDGLFYFLFLLVGYEDSNW